MSCREIAPLLAERSTGPLPAADQARLAAHLSGCAACRSEAARLDDLLALLRLPGSGEAEEQAATLLPARVLAGVRAPRAAPSRLAWAAAGAAAALAVSLGIGAGMRARPVPEGEVVAAADASDAWQEPDPDELWEWAGQLSLDSEESP